MKSDDVHHTHRGFRSRFRKLRRRLIRPTHEVDVLEDLFSDPNGQEECGVVVDPYDFDPSEAGEVRHALTQVRDWSADRTDTSEVLPRYFLYWHSADDSLQREPEVSKRGLEDAWRDVLVQMSPWLDSRYGTLRRAQLSPDRDLQDRIIQVFERTLRLERDLASSITHDREEGKDGGAKEAYETLSSLVDRLESAVGTRDGACYGGSSLEEAGSADALVIRMREISHAASVSEAERLSQIMGSVIELMLETTEAIDTQGKGEGLELLSLVGQGDEYRKALIENIDHDPRLDGPVEPKRVETALRDAGASCALRDVAKMRAEELLAIRGVGEVSLHQTLEHLDALGVRTILGASAKYAADLKHTIRRLQENGILDESGRLKGQAGAVAEEMISRALYGEAAAWLVSTGEGRLSVPVLRSRVIRDARRKCDALLRDAGVSLV